MAKLLRSDTLIAPNLSIWLDMLRAPAALIVLFSHVYSLYFRSEGAHPDGVALILIYKAASVVAQCSHGAVMVFFVLSGYLVGGPHLIRTIAGTADGRRYAIARVARMYTVILPALLLTLALDALVMSWLHGAEFIAARQGFFHGRTDFRDYLSPGDAVCNATFMQMIWCKQFGSNAALWSLSNEGIYYAMWGGLMLAYSKRWALIIPAALMLIILTSPFVIGADARVSAYVVYLFVWVMGALTFALKPPLRLTLIALGIMIAFWIAGHNHIPQLASDALLSLVTCALLKFLETSNIRPPADLKAVKGAAEISFSLYATHLPVAICIMAGRRMAPHASRTWGDILALFSITLGCLIVSVGFWALFEKNRKVVAQWLVSTELRRLTDFLRFPSINSRR